MGVGSLVDKALAFKGSISRMCIKCEAHSLCPLPGYCCQWGERNTRSIHRPFVHSKKLFKNKISNNSTYVTQNAEYIQIVHSLTIY